MATNERMTGSEYSNLYTQMNVARTRLSRPTISVPDVSKTIATSAQMKQAETDLDNTRLSDSRIYSRYSKSTFSGIEIGNLCKYNTITQFQDVITLYKNVPTCFCISADCSCDCDCDDYHCPFDGVCPDCGCDGDGGGCAGGYCPSNCFCVETYCSPY